MWLLHRQATTTLIQHLASIYQRCGRKKPKTKNKKQKTKKKGKKVLNLRTTLKKERGDSAMEAEIRRNKWMSLEKWVRQEVQN